MMVPEIANLAVRAVVAGQMSYGDKFETAAQMAAAVYSVAPRWVIGIWYGEYREISEQTLCSILLRFCAWLDEDAAKHREIADRRNWLSARLRRRSNNPFPPVLDADEAAELRLIAVKGGLR